MNTFENISKVEFKTTEILENFLVKTLLNLPAFEKVVFEEKFQNGDVIFLWDGIDDGPSFFKDFMINLTLKVNNLTENWQFASTRPQNSAEFQEKLNISAFALAPLDEERKFEFLLKFTVLDQLKLNVDDIYESIRPSLNFSLPIDKFLTGLRNSKAFSDLNKKQIDKILKIIENSYLVLKFAEKSIHIVSPTLIKIAVEAAKNKNFVISDDFNIFSLYENFFFKL